MLDKRWTEIMGNETLVKKMAEIREPEKMQELLKANGYEFSIEEIHAAGEELSAQYSAQSSGELSENDLEDVAGGSIILPMAAAAGALAAKRCTRCRR